MASGKPGLHRIGSDRRQRVEVDADVCGLQRFLAGAVRLGGNRLAALGEPSGLGVTAGPAGVAAVFLALAELLGGSGGMLKRWPLPRDVTG